MAIDGEILKTKWGEFVSLDQLSSNALQDGRFSVVVDEGLFECLLLKKDEPRLFVLLSGARDPRKHSLPLFHRWTWADKFPGNVLCISDPTLYLSDNLFLGWYLGTSERNWLKSMASTVAHVAKFLGVSDRRIVSYGSSGGGFAALMLAAELGHATAVAINPQVEVWKYWPKAVKQYFEVGFGGRSADQLTTGERARLSVIRAFKESREAKCLVVQNRLDEMHYSKHYTLFCKTFSVPEQGGADPSGRINSLTFDSPNGHASAEPKNLVPQLISRAVALADLNPASIGDDE